MQLGFGFVCQFLLVLFAYLHLSMQGRAQGRRGRSSGGRGQAHGARDRKGGKGDDEGGEDSKGGNPPPAPGGGVDLEALLAEAKKAMGGDAPDAGV